MTNVSLFYTTLPNFIHGHCAGLEENTSCLHNESATNPPRHVIIIGPSMVHRFWMDSVIGMPLGILGIIGNMLAFIVLARQKPRVTTTVVLMMLSITDNLVLISGIMLRSLRYLAVYTQTMHTYLAAYPQLFLILYPWVYFFRLFDMWLTVLLTVDRYIVVQRPLQASTVCTTRRAFRDMSIMAMCSIMFSIPRFFEHERTTENTHGFISSDLLTRRTYTIVYRIFSFFMLQYVIPLVLMIALNAILLSSLWRAVAQRSVYQKQQSSRTRFSSSSNSATRSVTIIVVIVVLICVVTNSLALTTHLLWSLEQCWPQVMGSLGVYRRYMATYSNMAISVNSASNLPIYYLCSKRFRKLVRDTLTSSCRARKNSIVMYQRRNPQARYLQNNEGVSGCPTTKTCRLNTNYISMSRLRPTKDTDTTEMKYN